ncbi:hypothetical protein HOD08_00415, partial [bacterium]|nr:hypothetical protein [bacterium]
MSKYFRSIFRIIFVFSFASSQCIAFSPAEFGEGINGVAGGVSGSIAHRLFEVGKVLVKPTLVMRALERHIDELTSRCVGEDGIILYRFKKLVPAVGDSKWDATAKEVEMLCSSTCRTELENEIVKNLHVYYTLLMSELITSVESCSAGEYKRVRKGFKFLTVLPSRHEGSRELITSFYVKCCQEILSMKSRNHLFNELIDEIDHLKAKLRDVGLNDVEIAAVDGALEQFTKVIGFGVNKRMERLANNRRLVRKVLKTMIILAVVGGVSAYVYKNWDGKKEIKDLPFLVRPFRFAADVVPENAEKFMVWIKCVLSDVEKWLEKFIHGRENKVEKEIRELKELIMGRGTSKSGAEKSEVQNKHLSPEELERRKDIGLVGVLLEKVDDIKESAVQEIRETRDKLNEVTDNLIGVQGEDGQLHGGLEQRALAHVDGLNATLSLRQRKVELSMDKQQRDQRLREIARNVLAAQAYQKRRRRHGVNAETQYEGPEIVPSAAVPSEDEGSPVASTS